MDNISSKAIAIIQARMTSTRLPGKVLEKLSPDYNCLELLITRLRKKFLGKIVVATTSNKSDNPIEEESLRLGVSCYRGDELNVLSRFQNILSDSKEEVIVRLTADCPYFDSFLLLEALRIYEEEQNPLKIIRLDVEESFPRGFDFEVFSRELFLKATRSPSNKVIEHVTPEMYLNKSLKQAVKSVPCPVQGAGHLRFTLDTPQDLEFLKLLEKKYLASDLGWREIIFRAKEDVELQSLNSLVRQKNIRD